MNVKEKLSEIKKIIFEKQEEEIEKFLDVKDKEGNIYRLPEDGLKEGVEIKVIGEDGELTPAPDGTYEIEGNTVEIKDGKVVSVTEIAKEEEASKESEEKLAEDAPKEDAPKEDEKVDEIAELTARVENLENAVNEIITLINEGMTEIMSKIANNEKAIEEFGLLPGGESKTENKQEEKQENKFKNIPVKSKYTLEGNPLLQKMRNLKK